MNVVNRKEGCLGIEGLQRLHLSSSITSMCEKSPVPLSPLLLIRGWEVGSYGGRGMGKRIAEGRREEAM